MPRTKQAVAVRAASLVKNGQRVGLGTGSTTAFALHELSRRQREEGLSIECVATSYSTQILATELGLRLLPLHQVSWVDISIDGADEVDPEGNLIKGGGAAHTLEKLVHSMSHRFIAIVDESKLVERLGMRFAVPVEVVKESLSYATSSLAHLGFQNIRLRSGSAKDGPIITDNGNFILDGECSIASAADLEEQINRICGVVENGIFPVSRFKMERIIIGFEDGRIEERMVG